MCQRLKAGGKPSTWLPPERLVKLFIEARRSRILKADTLKTRVSTWKLKSIIPHDNLTDYDENKTKKSRALKSCHLHASWTLLNCLPYKNLNFLLLIKNNDKHKTINQSFTMIQQQIALKIRPKWPQCFVNSCGRGLDSTSSIFLVKTSLNCCKS